MEPLELVIHTNKRHRPGELANVPYGAPGMNQQYLGPGHITSQHSGSDQSSGSDVRSGSDLAASMSRSVSDSSLALSGLESRSSAANPMQPYGAGYPASDNQNQHMIMHSHGHGGPVAGSMVQTASNGIPFQENPSSTNRGLPPTQLNQAFLLPNSTVTPVHGCMPATSLPMSAGHAVSGMTGSLVTGGPLTQGPLSNGAAIVSSSQGNGFVAHSNGFMPSATTMTTQAYQQNSSITSTGFRGSESQPQNTPAPPMPKWDPTSANQGATPSTPVVLEPPCAACKSLRRKCTRDCIFLPYFPRDDPDKFARVHKVFGASNVAKMLQDLPVHQREDTVASLEYEAQARVQDPVFGCVGILCLLQKQIAMLQNQVTELQRQQGIAPRSTVQDGGAQPSISNSLPSVVTGGSQ